MPPQLTNDNSLTDLQDRKRAPSKQLRRCLENHTRSDSSMSKISDDEVDYGSFSIVGSRKFKYPFGLSTKYTPLLFNFNLDKLN